MGLNLVLLIGGTFSMGCGLWHAFSERRPHDTIAGFLALAGLLSALMGTLRLCVPGFFG